MNGCFLKFYMAENRRHHSRLAYEWLLEEAKRFGLHGGSAFRALAASAARGGCTRSTSSSWPATSRWRWGSSPPERSRTVSLPTRRPGPQPVLSAGTGGLRVHGRQRSPDEDPCPTGCLGGRVGRTSVDRRQRSLASPPAYSHPLCPLTPKSSHHDDADHALDRLAAFRFGPTTASYADRHPQPHPGRGPQSGAGGVPRLGGAGVPRGPPRCHRHRGHRGALPARAVADGRIRGFGAQVQRADASIAGGFKEFLLLAARREDADTLFFARRLRMSGNTELGLYLKNFLDAFEPPRTWQPLFQGPGRLADLPARVS